MNHHSLATGDPAKVTRTSLKMFGYESIDVCDENNVPERVTNSQLSNRVIKLKTFLEKTGSSSSSSSSSTAETKSQDNQGGGPSASTSTSVVSTAAGRKCAKRLMKELRMLSKNPHCAIRIFPSEDNICFWRVIISGPESTPYVNGTWLLTMEFPTNFPRSPPHVRFVTKILHCNINSYGRVCHSILDRNWSSETRVKTVLDCIYGLLLAPDVDDPLGTCVVFLLSLYHQIIYILSLILHIYQLLFFFLI